MNRAHTQILDTALRYLGSGLSIIPVNTDGPRAKKPHFHALHGTGHSRREERGGRPINIPTWAEFQTTRATEAEVTEWVTQHGVTGFAVVTGQISGIVGIDFDQDGLGTLAHLNWRPHVLTPSGGAHIYVKHPGHHVKTMKASGIKDDALRLPAGIDVRGDGGYILLPPTTITGKGQYQRTEERKFLPIAAIPELLMDGERACRFREVLGLTPPAPQPAPAPTHVAAPTFSDNDQRPPLDPILKRTEDLAWGGKGRNEAGFWFACQMRDNGYTEGETLMCHATLVSLFPSSDTKGDVSPYTEREFTDSVRSAYRRAARSGWQRGYGQ